MDNNFWWDTDNDKGFINSVLKFSVEARKWYLKTDIKVRLKHFLLFNDGFDEIIYLWKRLKIVKNDLGEETGSLIIREAIKEIQDEFNDPEFKKSVREKINRIREGMNDDNVKMI